MNKKETRGGKRPNAGRKPSPYKTTTVSVRIRVEWADEMRKFIADKKRELEARKQLSLCNVVGQSEQLKAFREWWNKDNEGVCTTITHKDIDRYLKSL